ncbi:F-actin-monooxygenase Mical-like isoform X2 [Plodia interpunctella]|uniref:F-actin-monooxygenase Mical-like isoform X2 n=1 Tax=Plodia interpunctella TaxID=58824 RepID=UPI002368EEE4|nr:F-actin-monooxygenase Mical-like isoform X2 [Plodia interpunctella]
MSIKMNRGVRVEATPPECALAAEMFDHFCAAGTMKQILALHREICNTLTLRPNRLPDFYPKLKAKLASSWKAQALFKKFDARANHKVYSKGRACTATRALIIGAGPCGLRAAIECQLLGAKVVVIEKRDRMSRNNVLHLWPFVIQDLRALGAKKFFGKFCAGSIDHISIRQLQCILLKVALLLGVEFHEGVSFEELLEPTDSENSETLGWRARVTPLDHPVSQYEFDTLLGADGKRNTLQGFKRKEFRGKLAMAITANFINRHTEQEASVPEISGVAFIFNQKFFKELYENTGIDLENIVYYKDDTHYFVMTAKKHSLLDKGVLLNDYSEVSRLLSVENVDRAALMKYAQEAARFSTCGRLPLRHFALNHYGEPDVALFDFTSMYAAENASIVYERLGRRLLCQLVGDSLLEPFWPTGSGCARGFLSALDAAWAVRAWGQSPAPHPLEVIAERESIYRLLAQTTPENLHRDFGAYTLDPGTRYPNLNRTAVTPHRVTGFYDSDDPLPLDAKPSAKKRRRETEISEDVLIKWVGWSEGGLRAAASGPALAAAVRRYRPDLLPDEAPPAAVYHSLHGLGIPLPPGDSLRDVPDAKVKMYLSRVYNFFKGEVPHVQHDDTNVFDQIKESLQNEKRMRNSTDHSLSVYSNAADADKSHSNKKKRRSNLRQVSTEPAELLRRRIGRLQLDDVTALAGLLQSHDTVSDQARTDKQRDIQQQILALLDPDESPDPTALRQSLAQLLQGGNTTVNATSQIANYFRGEEKPKSRKLKGLDVSSIKIPDFSDFSDMPEEKPVRPPRKLKGLDPATLKVPDFSDLFQDDSADTDATLVTETSAPSKTQAKSASASPKKKHFVRSSSTEGPFPQKGRRVSDVLDLQKRRHSQSPVAYPFARSNSLDSPEIAPNTKRIAQLFENHKSRHTPSPESRTLRSGSVGNPEMALRMQRMAEIIEGKRRSTPSPDRAKRSESIGNPEMALRKQRVVDLMKGQKPKELEPFQRKNSGDANSNMAFRMQRVSEMIQKKNAEAKRAKGGGRRRAARDLMRQRFEKSLQMLASEPRPELPAADLEHDYGLQQYRASAPHFGERVRNLEKQLQHYEEGRIVGVGARAAGGGVRVAKLAAELAGSSTTTAAPKSSKPKDLMRSVGKIERDDWNVKEIERKIMENRLGRPEPKTAEKVPKWDREQFLGRQRRLREGDAGDEKWCDIDVTLNKLEQKLRDSGRPDHGTNKVANLANKFVKKDDTDHAAKSVPKEELKKSWRGPSFAGMQCAACGTRVFAAEGVTADGLHLHRACFRCAVCKAVLRPGNYTMERYGSRLVCLRHSGVNVPDAVAAPPPLTATPERISLELSDSGAREIDEDEWTDRNFLASETSCAGLSDDEESSSDEYTDAGDSGDEARQSPLPAPAQQPSHDMYFSDDSFGYDDYSDTGAESSGNESCSRMREAREARRREVPADQRPPTDSSEVESEDESSSSSVSSATEVSTDSEFAEEPPAPSPPAILVTEPPPPAEYPLSRARSAGGLATKRALELKRRYLLGEPSPPTVRKSDSTSQLDTKLEAFRSNITEFQKMLHPAPTPTIHVQKPVVTFQLAEEKKTQPMPDIIKNLCDAPVDLLTKGDSPLCKPDWKEPSEETKEEPDLDSDSLSEDESSHTETAPNQSVPRVEVHDEGGELIQLDSLMLINSSEADEKASGTATATTTTAPTVVAADSESSESGRDATTLALTETELSDWAAESGVLEDCGLDDKDERRRTAPRTLSGPKSVHDAKNISAITSHVCGRTSPEPVVYSNAFDNFEFADEGEQDPSIETPTTPRNEGYMEFVDEDYDAYSPSNDRSMNFIESSFSETVLKPISQEVSSHEIADITAVSPVELSDPVEPEDSKSATAEQDIPDEAYVMSEELKSPQLLKTIENVSIESSSESAKNKTVVTNENKELPAVESKIESLSLSDLSPPLEKDSSYTDVKSVTKTETPIVDQTSPHRGPLTPNTLIKYNIYYKNPPDAFTGPTSIRLYSPAICRSASENFTRSNSRSTDSPSRSMELSISINLSSGSMSPVSPTPLRDTIDKVQEIKKEREEQTEVVRKLVLERLGSAPRKSSRRIRISTSTSVPPPVPPPPAILNIPPPVPPPCIPPPPPRPAPPRMPLPVTPSLSDPELARERRSKSIMKSISSYLNRRLGPQQKWRSEPALPTHEPARAQRMTCVHKSTGALQDPPPVPPPPAGYYPPAATSLQTKVPGPSRGVMDERYPAQMRVAAPRWPQEEPSALRVARIERRLRRPLSAEQQAAFVAELVQVRAQRTAHTALLADNRRRTAGGRLGD